jgi:hypothetical protein
MEDLSVDGRLILKMDLQEVEWGMGWIDLAQSTDRQRYGPPGSIKCGEFLD